MNYVLLHFWIYVYFCDLSILSSVKLNDQTILWSYLTLDDLALVVKKEGNQRISVKKT